VWRRLRSRSRSLAGDFPLEGFGGLPVAGLQHEQALLDFGSVKSLGVRTFWWMTER
jgi:hypothetical protein